MKRAKVTKRPYTYKGKTEDRWVVLWTDPKGARREKWLPNKRHADAHAAKIDRDIDRGIHEVGTGKKTFGELWKAFIAHCEHRKKIGDLAGATLASCYTSGNHILPEFGQRQIGKITSVDVEAWVFKKRETLARATVEGFYGYLSFALNYAVRNKWLATNPLRDDPVRIPGRKQQRPYIPAFEDIELLIQILHGPGPGRCEALTWENQKIAFALRAFAGLRGGEIAALRWDAINLSATTLRVDKDAGSVSDYDGLKGPKSEASIRTNPISQYVYDALLEHGHATDMKGFVIKNSATADKYVGSQTTSDMHRDLMVWANLTKPDGNVKFVGHDLRHWWVSVRLAMGHNLVAVSKQAGHHDPSITTRVYSHVIEGTEDGLKDTVAPIWHQRLARAEPGRVTMIEGVASERGLLIDGTATPLETAIPENVGPPWVPEALRLLEGGWRPADVSRHLGQNRTNINRAFHRLGLPHPDKIRLKVRDRKFQELHDAGYTDKQIEQKLNCTHGTVYRWRRTMAEGLPNTRAGFRQLEKPGPVAKKLTDAQVHEVWDRLEAGETFASIAKRFSISTGPISSIKRGETYQWVKQEREENEAAQNPDKPLKYKEKRQTTEVVTAEKLRESQLKLL